MNKFKFENKKSKNYFEGWYFRVTNSKTNDNYAFIFAITQDVNDPHSFIQSYNGKTNKSYYYRFDKKAFSYDKKTNTIHIGENYLNEQELYFKNDMITFHATSSNHQYLKRYQLNNSAMGFFSITPLECFQEIIFLDADVNFDITTDGVLSTNTGKSYMEKTYGTNFPKKWIWAQSNYSQNDSKISFSVGIVSLLFFRIKGFFLILYYQGKEERFGNFNFSRIDVEKIDETTNKIKIKKGRKLIELTVKTNSPIKIVGPRKKGIMDLDVFESINASASIKVYRKKVLIFEDSYTNVGLELMYY
jgi:tocopherol cyclase